MIDELTHYKNNGHFFFYPTNKLHAVCNAPTDKSGVYVIYELRKGKVNLVYIGSSGKLNKDGTMFIPKAGLGGLKNGIVNGHQFGNIPRRYAWPAIMLQDNIHALDIYWYATHDDKYTDDPRTIENKLLHKYLDIYGHLPKWNEEL